MEIGAVAACSSLSGLIRAGGCGSPVLYSVALPDRGTKDPGLIGQWVADGRVRIDVVIEDARAGVGPTAYLASLIVHDQYGYATALGIDLLLTDVGASRYIELSLARRERVRLINAYGLLAAPVHLVMKIERMGDTLTIRPYTGEFTARAIRAPHRRDRNAMDDDAIDLVTTPTGLLRSHLVRHADDPRVFGEPITFRRMVRQ